MSSQRDPLLRVSGLFVSYGPVRAIHGVDVEVHRGEIRAFLGANGSGKSTLMKAIMGLVPVEKGEITLDGHIRLRGLEPHQVVQHGIAWAPQGRQTFATLSVHENLLMGAFNVRQKATVAQRLDQMYDLFPILRTRSRQLAGSMSGGEQQMLSIARALMSAPRLLLLDEPSIGLAPVIVRRVFDLIRTINRAGTTVLLAEQNALQALRAANWAYVLEGGRIAASNSPAALESSQAVQRAYLGDDSPQNS